MTLRRSLLLLVGLIFLTRAEVASAAVLCARTRADGTFNATVKIREQCKPTETELDVATLGLQGPKGDQGPTGTIPCASVNGTDVFFSGCNVHITNGTGSTQTSNGTGNLIIGYDEPGLCSLDQHVPQTACNEDTDCALGSCLMFQPLARGGSHNLILGSSNQYSSYGGIVAGQMNSVFGPYSSVLGGEANSAGSATAYGGTVVGGADNHALARGTVVSGGESNDATGVFSSISGGYLNKTLGTDASVSGGKGNRAEASLASISGGYVNVASGIHSSILGGSFNTASGLDSSVTGGTNNTAAGTSASVSGGSGRSATDENNWAAGSLFEPN